MVIVSPLTGGVMDPFQIAFSWLVNGGYQLLTKWQMGWSSKQAPTYTEQVPLAEASSPPKTWLPGKPNAVPMAGQFSYVFVATGKLSCWGINKVLLSNRKNWLSRFPKKNNCFFTILSSWSCLDTLKIIVDDRAVASPSKTLLCHRLAPGSKVPWVSINTIPTPAGPEKTWGQTQIPSVTLSIPEFQ